MIYWDNAATTRIKPITVRQSVCQAISLYSANPGRAGHNLSLDSAEQVFLCRQAVADFFGLHDPSGVVFTLNCTMALNMVIFGVLGCGGRAVTSDLEHNAVMRPLAALSEGIARYDTVQWCADEDELVERFRRSIRPDTRLLICTHASNVFGVTLPIRKLGELAHRYGLLFCVDAAQTAGVLPIDMERDHIDYLCVAAHKGLYAPMGTGVLLCRETECLSPLVRGGTGSQSLSLLQPDELPDRLESGTPNVSGICGLRAGVAFVKDRGQEQIYHHEMGLLQYVYDRLRESPHIRMYTPRPSEGDAAAVLSINVGELPSEEVAAILNERQIAVRAGLHCAPAAHRHFGTQQQGTVRLAPSVFSNRAEAEYICKVFLQIAEKTLH
ncbi:MAG: aminotransferase class V-fold PLP-dependent enzyme [Clostridia bacterium]|nr:aminotransferase class V-fold PLP-dependent enzyme [Clostridia bacterium]